MFPIVLSLVNPLFDKSIYSDIDGAGGPRIIRTAKDKETDTHKGFRKCLRSDTLGPGGEQFEGN